MVDVHSPESVVASASESRIPNPEGLRTVSDIGERALIERIHTRIGAPPPWVIVGIGDDAAVIEPERQVRHRSDRDRIVDYHRPFHDGLQVEDRDLRAPDQGESDGDALLEAAGEPAVEGFPVTVEAEVGEHPLELARNIVDLLLISTPFALGISR